MKPSAVGDLIHLTERAAVTRSFDGFNYRVLRRLLVVTTPLALIAGLILATDGHPLEGASWAPVLAASLTVIIARRSPWFEQYGRSLAMSLLAALGVATALSFPEPLAGYVFAGFVLPALLPFFRWRWVEYLIVAGFHLGAMTMTLLREGMPTEPWSRIGLAALSLAFVTVVLGVAANLTRRARKRFLDLWRHDVSRERDRRRMRSELEDAKEIQLSMLPAAAPAVAWADFASLSLPASEVGGDYFDYFELADSRLAVVIGDVAGHGVASGLVLSGVRSSLHLLHDELVRPVRVLEKLDRMLRATVGGRLFITFQIVVLDPVAGTVRVANAGHPPLFHAKQDGSVHRLGTPGLPLGTRLEGGYTEQEAALAEGDTLLLFSDGVPEVRNLGSDDFGDRRLLAALQSLRPEAGARLIRDSLLNTVSRFKGDAELEDDLTMVVLKVGSLAAI